MSDADHGSLMSKVHCNNFGARAICFKVFDELPLPDSERLFLSLIEKGITGSRLYSFYKDECSENLETLIKKLS